MDPESVRSFARKLPYVEETVQWGNNLLFWVGDKAIGGKMFAVLNLDGDGAAVLSFAAGQQRYAELLETEGVIPAPYLARIFWVALERWDALHGNDLQTLLIAARDLTFAKLPKRTKDVLAMEPAAKKRLLAERKKRLASAAAAEKAAPASKKTAVQSKPAATTKSARSKSRKTAG